MKASYLVPMNGNEIALPPMADGDIKLGMLYQVGVKEDGSPQMAGGLQGAIGAVSGAKQAIVLIDASSDAHAQFAIDFLQLEVVVNESAV